MKRIIIFLLASVFVFTACEDEYLIDGGTADQNVNMTTFDFLKTNEIFDTLTMLIEQAGLVSAVNEAGTFIVPTDFSIKRYLDNVVADLRVFDPEAQFNLSDIPADTLEMLKSYLIPQRVTRDDMEMEGRIYTTVYGDERKLSLEPRAVYTGYLTEFPSFVFFYKKRGETWNYYGQTGIPVDERDHIVQVRTSDIITTTGVVHVLQGNHTLFFYERQY